MPFVPTNEQAAVIAHDLTRHARILAGPGTGKSATVIALLASKAGELGGPAKLITFTRAATAELVDKLGEEPDITCERPATLHSFCISVLLQNDGVGEFPRPLRMADDWEKSELVEASLSRRLGIPKQRVRTLFSELAANWESLAPQEDEAVPADERARFMGAWGEHRRILGYTLPSELPYALRMALQDHADLAGLDYQLLVVDEYQDLNSCDLEILRLIAGRGCAVIAAGDDDQSIYSFRKAHPAGIRQFAEHYENAADYPLSVTQRCGRAIIEWANHVIQGDPDRAPGRVLNPVAAAPPGEVALFSYQDQNAEARGVARLAQDLIERGVPAHEVLILLRGDHNGSFSRPIKEQLAALGIAYSDPSTVKAALDDPASRRAQSFVRLLANREDSLSWATLLELTPGIGPAFFNHIYETARAERCSFARALLDAHAAGFGGVREPTRSRAAALIAEVLRWAEATVIPDDNEVGWGTWITGALAESPAPAPEALVELMQQVDERTEPDVSLGQYLSQLGPTAKDLALAKADGVRIMTMASSKGLTVQAAILVGLESGVMPSERGDPAEERRLLYVAMTRAKQFLYGTWARRRTGPTARAGRNQVWQARRLTPFLEGGPVRSVRAD